jgi:hypothetical protein
MRSRYKAKVSDGQEADDDMAIAHMALWTSDPMSSCIATIDKDLDTVQGLHYNFATKVGRYIEPLEARRFFWQQMISGDTVDNIPGVPGYGKIKAEKLMADWKGDEWDAYQRVRALYVQAYDDKADDAIVEMGRLLYIRQRPDEWWNPPKEADNGCDRRREEGYIQRPVGCDIDGRQVLLAPAGIRYRGHLACPCAQLPVQRAHQVPVLGCAAAVEERSG